MSVYLKKKKEKYFDHMCFFHFSSFLIFSFSYMAELFSLLSFVEPQLFQSQELFTRWFSVVDWKKANKSVKEMSPSATLDKKNKHLERLEILHTLIRPFLLQRMKSDVNLKIPSKREVILYAGLSEMQKKYYKWILTKNVQELSKKGSNKTNLMNIVMHLRKCCNHPYLFDGAEPTFDGEFILGNHIVENSAKMVILDSLLPKLQKEGHKILIYSQMTRMLDILQDYMSLRSFPYERLDGSCRSEERFLAIKNFNENKETFAFLLSTRAGGVGLNLVSANFVLFFDSDWNPQMDKQAEARAHRIGQTKDVTVIRLVSKKTVEEIMLQRAKRKLQITQAVIENGSFGKTNEEDKKSDITSKENLFSVIKYSLRDVVGDEYTVSPITDKDIDLIINPPKEIQQNQTQSLESNINYDTNVASFGGTLELMDDSDSDEDDDSNKKTVVYDVQNLPDENRSKEDEKSADEYLNKFISENGGADVKSLPTRGKRSRSPVIRDRQPPSKKQKVSHSPSKQRKKNVYVSASISLDQDHDENEIISLDDSDDSDDLLQFCVGDVTKPIGDGNMIVAW